MKSLFSLVKANAIVKTVVAGFVSVAVVYLGIGKDAKKPEEAKTKEAIAQEQAKQKAAGQKQASLSEKKTSQKKERVPYRGNKFEKLKEEVDYYAETALTDDASCKTFIQKEIENPDYIDPKSKKFNSAPNIIGKIESLSRAVDRKNSKEAYRNLEKLVFHKDFYKNNVEVSNVRSYMAKIEVCRDPHLFNFLLSSIEAANDRKWKPEVRKELHNKISKYFVEDLEKFPSSVTLAYSTQYLKGLVLNNFIDDSYREEILTLMNEVMENQMETIGSMSDDEELEDNLMTLQEDFKQRKYFGERVKSLFHRIDQDINF